MDCIHPYLVQLSEAILRWSWERQEDGTYKPAETHDKVISEDTLEFKCQDCGAIVFLDEDNRIDLETPPTRL